MKYKFYCLLICLIIFSCARYESLTGGEADKVAPKITKSDPVSDSTNINDLSEVYFEFSEMVDRKSFENHFYIQPFMKYRPRFEWSGWTELRIFLKDTIKDNITYQIVVAKGFKDLHGVPSENEYRIAVTKSDKLDSLSFEGNIKTDQKFKQLRIALYKNLNLEKYPDYIADFDQENNFNVNHVKDGAYIPIFFNDKNSNYKVDLSDEELFIGYNRIELTKNILLNYHSRFSKTDTISPVLEKLDTLEFGILKLNSKDDLDVRKTELYFRDSLNNRVKVKQFVKKSANEYFIFLPDTTYQFPLTLASEKLVDVVGNITDSINYKLSVDNFAAKDTNEFKINTIIPGDSTYLSNLKGEFELTFSKSVSYSSFAKDAFRLLSGKNKTHELEIEQHDKNKIRVKAKEELDPSEDYILRIKKSSITSWYGDNLKDTVVDYRYYGISKNKFGWISFTLKSSSRENIYLELYRLENKEKRLYTKKRVEPGNVIIDNIIGGYYLMNFYLDKNKNSQHDNGRIKPLEFPEPYIFYPDTITIRPNWENNRKVIDLDGIIQ